jgi:Tfp pilus assembly protein PilV
MTRHRTPPPSTEPGSTGPRRRGGGQSGVSLVESVVASALMGIGVVGGLTAWDTASMSANRAVREAWATCIVRAELDAILSAQYASSYAAPTQFSIDQGDGTVLVQVAPPPGNRGGAEQMVTVEALDPQSRSTVLARMTVLKSRTLAGERTMADTLDEVRLGCPAR